VRWRTFRNGRQLRLNPTEFDMRALLMLNEGKTVARAPLLALTWG